MKQHYVRAFDITYLLQKYDLFVPQFSVIYIQYSSLDKIVIANLTSESELLENCREVPVDSLPLLRDCTNPKVAYFFEI